MVISWPGKVIEKEINANIFGKVVKICYNHVIIYMVYPVYFGIVFFCFKWGIFSFFHVYTPEISQNVWSWKFSLKS